MKFFNFLKSDNNNVKTIRIPTQIGDKYVTVKLNQTYDSLDILSLKIFQKDLYRMYDAEYGIICGRAIGNGGVGIPNCKISIFIPLDDENLDLTTLAGIKNLEIASLYPYKNVTDTNSEGKVYNLLPRYSRNRNFNGFPDNEFGIGATPKTPLGTFPEKEEVLINETVAELYDKYLRYSTITNESGDYILCVPSNQTYTVHMSCDITDIGRFSTTPALLQLEGYPDNLFTNNGTTINENNSIENSPNIELQNLSIFVKPLWTQDDNNVTGINRLDFFLKKEIKPHSIVFGNFFTQNKKSWWGDRIIFRLFFGLMNLCLGTCPQTPTGNFFMSIGFRLSIDVSLFKFDKFIGITAGGAGQPTSPNTFSFCIGVKNILPFFNLQVFKNKMCTLGGGKSDLEPFGVYNLGKTGSCSREDALSVLTDLSDDIFLKSHERGSVDLKIFTIKNTISEIECNILNTTLDENVFDSFDYQNDIQLLPKNRYVEFQNDGNIIVLIPSNRNKVITNEEGLLVEVPNDSKKGVFTSFRGYFYLKNNVPIDNPPSRFRTGKINLKIPQFFDYNNNFKAWIWRHFKFDYGKLYSFAQYNRVLYSNMSSEKEATDDDNFFELVLNYLVPTTMLFDIPDKVRGWDEQTNLLFIGAFESDTKTVINLENTIVDNDTKQYSNMFNHITCIGKDNENSINVDDFNTEFVDTETETNDNTLVPFIVAEDTLLFLRSYIPIASTNPLPPDAFIDTTNWGYSYFETQSAYTEGSNNIIFSENRVNALNSSTVGQSFQLLITYADNTSNNKIFTDTNWIISFRYLDSDTVIYDQVMNDGIATFTESENFGNFIVDTETVSFYRKTLIFRIKEEFQSEIQTESNNNNLLIRIYNLSRPEQTGKLYVDLNVQLT
jgi:hypothetical protein